MQMMYVDVNKASLNINLFFSLSWSKFYSPDRYPVEFEPPTPCVRDPTNPGYNVAAGLIYWGQFRTELALWLRSLNI